MENIPEFVTHNSCILNCWYFITKKLINYLQEKMQKDSFQNQYFSEIKGINNFIKKLTNFVVKNGFKYLLGLHKSRKTVISMEQD